MRAWDDVRDEHRTERGAIRTPELGAVDQVVGRKEERAVDVCLIGSGGHGAGGAGNDVLDERGTAGGAVAVPQLAAVRPVIGAENNVTVDVSHLIDVRAGPARIDVLDHHGAGST